MSIYNWLQENFFLRVHDIISGKSIANKLQFLLKSQYWPYEQLVSYQEERLKFIIRHAYDKVPFYHDLFNKNHLMPSDIKSIGDLHKIPVISKDDLRKHPFDYYLSSDLKLKKYIHLNSSGSTGEPFQYLITSEAFSTYYACAIRGWYWMGYRLGDTYSKLSQNPRTSFQKKLQDKITRNNYLYIRDLSPDNLIEIIHRLNHSKPNFLRCYPDPLYFLSRLLNEENRLKFSLKAINTTGNILTPDARAKIEKAFNAPVFDSYSCEGSAQFFEGPDRKTYFSSMEYAITEVIDNNNNPVELGRHITTDLWNLAMPFIRYDTQDIIERSDMVFNSPINLEPFKQIKGRNSDILVTPSGKYLIVHTFTIFFEYFKEITKFQVIQYKPDKIKVILVVNKFFNEKTLDEIKDGLIDLIGKDMHIEIETVPDIAILPSGKRKFIIRDESIKIPL